MQKTLKYLIVCLLAFAFALTSCKPSGIADNGSVEKQKAQKITDTVAMQSDDGDYEIIIIEPGFNAWLQSTARQPGFYSQSFLESRNRLFVQEYNLRVMQPQRYNPNLYELRIDYQSNINYGYDLNYKLYNYFIYFQIQYKQQLSSFIPRI